MAHIDMNLIADSKLTLDCVQRVLNGFEVSAREAEKSKIRLFFPESNMGFTYRWDLWAPFREWDLVPWEVYSFVTFRIPTPSYDISIKQICKFVEILATETEALFNLSFDGEVVWASKDERGLRIEAPFRETLERIRWLESNP